MNTPYILLLQSATSAMIEIVLLILGAGLICFLTAWFYQKSVYTPVIKKLEAEKEELIRKIEGLNKEIENLKGKIATLENSIREKDSFIAQKNKEIDELKNPKK
jgi:peptidoglycan hydrolase CwlO-like protein